MASGPPVLSGEQSADWNLLQQKTAPVRTGPELFAHILKLLDRVVDSQCEDHRCQCPHGVVGDATAQQRGQQSQRGKTAGCIYRQLVWNADNINAGLFTYPALMAADILLYQADLVPVGGDQKQHVEICRDIATRFNGLYGDTFKLPDPYIPKVGARIMSLTTPTSKMSKSDKDQNGCVYMLEKPEDILRKFKKAMTDSDACVRFDSENKPGVSNLMQIYSVATGRDYAAIEAEFAGQGYGNFKTTVGESVVELLRPIREETERLLADKAYLESVYRAGAEKAAYVANRTLSKVYKKVGFLAR